MANKTLGIIGMILGVLCVASNLIVAFVGWPWLYALVEFPAPGFGWRKIVLIVLGVAVFIVGLVLYDRAAKLQKAGK